MSGYPVTEILASATRGIVIAPPGSILTVGDYANVEGRALAWLAGEQWKLQAFRDYDAGVGPDLYKVAYSKSFGVPVDEVDEGDERQIGKVQELMLGYGGGVGAFVTGAATYKIELATIVDTAWPMLPDDVREETAGMWEWACEKGRTLGLDEKVFRTCDGVKRLWRRRHPKIEKLWGDMEDAVRNVASGAVSSATLCGGRITIDKVKAWLRIRGPSGSYISYPGIRVGDKGAITYLGQNQYTRQWSRVGTYGGKLTENITQWVCRELLAQAMLNCEDEGVEVVLHVHDELVAEDADPELLAQCMKRVTWAEGLPLSVAVFQTDRYHKD